MKAQYLKPGDEVISVLDASGQRTLPSGPVELVKRVPGGVDVYFADRCPGVTFQWYADDVDVEVYGREEEN